MKKDEKHFWILEVLLQCEHQIHFIINLKTKFNGLRSYFDCLLHFYFYHSLVNIKNPIIFLSLKENDKFASYEIAFQEFN